MGWPKGIGMAPAAGYDEIADWYEDEFLPRTAAAGAGVPGIGRALRQLLGPGSGVCLEIGCGTGVRAMFRLCRAGPPCRCR